MSESSPSRVQSPVSDTDTMDTTSGASEAPRAMEQGASYELFTRSPMFIMVGKKGRNNTTHFYNAPRDIRPIPSLEYDHTLDNLSLIIAAFFHTHPQRKIEVKDGVQMIDPKTKEPKKIVDFNSIKSYVRYFGFVDLDMPLDEVLTGAKPLCDSIPERKYKNMDELKPVWNQWLKAHKDYTVGQFRQESKPFDAVCRDAQQLVACLAAKNKEYIFFFSGCKGFRVLWYDPQLFFWVFTEEDYARAYKQKIAVKYFTDLGCDVSFALRLDVSVYDKNKGVKPDVLPHPDSLLYTWLVEDHSKLDEYKLVRFNRDNNLVSKVKKFWTKLPAQCPLKVPHLRWADSNQPTLFDQQQRTTKRKQPEPNNNSSVEQSMPEMVTGDAPTESPAMFTDEIKKALVSWMKQQLMVRKKKFPNAGSLYIPMDPFPSHHIKRVGDSLVLTINEWHWCAIAHKDKDNGDGRDHAANKMGKVYFVISDTQVKQKCHSAGCKGNYYPIYTVEAEKERLSNSNKLAKRLCQDQRKKEQEAYEREVQRRFEARSPSPDSRMSVDTKYLPRYTESEGPLLQPNKPVTEETPEPLLISEPLPWYRYRVFANRLDCKKFYLSSFQITEQGVHGTPIYPLVVSLEDGFTLEANYVLAPSQQLSKYMQNPEFKKFWLYVVVFDAKLKRCAEWGFMSRDKLTLKQGDSNQYLLLRDNCKPGITHRQCAALFRATRSLPRLILMNNNKGGYKEYFDEKSKDQWQQEGYTIPEDENSQIQISEEDDVHIMNILRRVMANTNVTPFYLTDSIQRKLHYNYKDLVQQVEVCETVFSEQQQMQDVE